MSIINGGINLAEEVAKEEAGMLPVQIGFKAVQGG
jgi:hypothetical protein